MDNINKIWPKWETIEIIGRGGFGTVYKAKRENFGEVSFSAIKVVKIPSDDIEVKEMTSSGLSKENIQEYYKKSVMSLLDEIKLMEKMKSASHVVGIEDYEVVENKEGIGWTIYIRMELLTNSLNYFKQNTPTVEEVKKMAIHILSALEHCHELNIMHRDIKPANIFISKFNEYKLGDFGISKEVEKTNATLSQKGTKSYMAPEMVRSGKYNHTVDLYALGLSMYELLNHNRMPFLPSFPQAYFPQDREEAMLRRLNGEMIPEIEGIGSMNAIIQKACHPKAECRYQTATEMKKALLDLEVVEDVKDEIPFMFEEEEKTIGDDQSTIGNFGNSFLFEEVEEEEVVDDVEKIVQYIVGEFEDIEGINLESDSLAMMRIQDVAKQVQLDFQTKEEVVVDLPYITATQTGPKHLHVSVLRRAIQKEKNTSFLLMDPLQTECPYCKHTAYLQFTNGYYCPSCNKMIARAGELSDVCFELIHEQKDMNRRYELASRMLQLDPNNAQVNLRYGQVLGQLGRYEEQLGYYLKAVELDPRDAIIHNNIASCCITLNSYAMALFYAQKAMECPLKDCSTWNSLGVMQANFAVALDKNNRSKEAYQALVRAKKAGYANCEKLALDWNVGEVHCSQVVKGIAKKYNLTANNKVVKEKFQCPSNETIVMNFEPKGLFVDARYGLAIGQKALHFYSDGYWYTPYYLMPELSFSSDGKNLIIKQGKSTYKVQVGKDIQKVINILTELKNNL